MNHRPTVKLLSYAWLTVLGLLTALATGKPALAIVVVPFGVALGIGLAAVERSEPRLRAEADTLRVIEGEPVELHIEIEQLPARYFVEVAVGLGVGLTSEEGGPATVGFPAPSDGASHVEVLHLLPSRWGAYAVGPIAVLLNDPARFFADEMVVPFSAQIRAHPQPEVLRSLVSPRTLRALAGARTAKAKGDGIEFADIRQMVPGDLARNLNWRVSSRRGEMFVNEHHPERNADIVLFLDTYTERTFSVGVRAAAALAAAYSSARDRVGIVRFGGVVSWVAPGTGMRHLYRVIDTVLATRAIESFVSHDLATLPRRMLPPGSAVLAISPLDDERCRRALVDLAEQDVDLAVIDLALDELVPPGRRPHEQMAHDLWQLQRWSVAEQLHSLAVPVVGWHGERGLSTVLLELEAWRRRR